ncbi:MAG: SDR family NAD(P)-dependent oxidoreductase [Myxococcales bacterium]|nr:SDR family NAD(P)-dependent oxidoreductase [Myxococcales bacterium]MCB9530415.1 SDR family NAD(P)-dependent oxidoreductase [Myxococcales bacterium]MCB9533662.1 SDR family NAD(P)-dependent oxidoreductase [Myxococcales bacterium]
MKASGYSGSVVLVTGADGFIGSHLVEALVHAGATVRALVYYNSWGSIGWLSDVPPDVRSAVEIVTGDVRDRSCVEAACAGAAYVFHLASLIAIPYSFRAAQSYTQTNIEGTLNVLEAARRTDSLLRMLHTSTSEVYGTAQSVPIDEQHPLVAQSPYAATKIAADKLVESYHHAFGLPVTTARPFNTFGPRQTPRAVIPTAILQALDRCDPITLGAIEPTRDFNYVSDTVAGMLALAQCDAGLGQVANIGAGREHSVGQMARLVLDLVGHDAPIVADPRRVRPGSSEVERLVCDASRMRRITDWEPRVSFEQGLQHTIEWLRANRSRYSAAEYAT